MNKVTAIAEAGAAEAIPLALTGVLDALAESVLVIAPGGGIIYANAAAEQFFEASAPWLCRQGLANMLPVDSPLFGLVEQARSGLAVVSEHGVDLSTPRVSERRAERGGGEQRTSIRTAPVADMPGHVVVTLQAPSIASKIDHQLTHRNAARSVTAMAGMLAHEVKNPLSGIRGAAQLLEAQVPPEDRELTQLICGETDRICKLVDDLEVFSDERPLDRAPVNIHEVLEHVRRLAVAGFARSQAVREDYDPSLPPVYGNRDQLVQVFLNLVKNASEAAPGSDGEIRLSTAYRHGVRLAVPGSGKRIGLPLVVEVRDNGAGIPDDLREHLFDPFVSTKNSGKGLGLALVAKIINDHSGVIEFESAPRRTMFRVMLPTVPVDEPVDEPVAGPVDGPDDGAGAP